MPPMMRAIPVLLGTVNRKDDGASLADAGRSHVTEVDPVRHLATIALAQPDPVPKCAAGGRRARCFRVDLRTACSSIRSNGCIFVFKRSPGLRDGGRLLELPNISSSPATWRGLSQGLD